MLSEQPHLWTFAPTSPPVDAAELLPADLALPGFADDALIEPLDDRLG